MNNYVRVSLPQKQNDIQLATSSATKSGTGVFYQAMPAVGADGKNVMKLIPVQRVNGQFVRIQGNNNLASTYRKATEFEPQRLFAHPIQISPNAVSHNKVPVLQPSIGGRYILKKPADANVIFNPGTGLAGTGTYNERVTVSTPIRVQVPVVASKVTQSVPVASPVLNCGKAVTLTNKKQLPVTVKSPVLPNGHYLQIPPNAQVKTLPASALPQAIKRRILTPPVSTTCPSRSVNNLPTVVYVSPVNTMKLGASSQAGPPAPPSHNRLPKASAQHLVVGPATSSAQCIRSIPMETRDPVTPIKWVVQERSDSTAPCLVPQNSSTMTSEILKTLAQMERVKGQGQSTRPNPTSLQASPTQVEPGTDNALVMCNGKVYFVAKKTPEFSDHSPDMQKISGTVTTVKLCPSKQATVDDNINQRNESSLPGLPRSSFSGPPPVNSPRQGMARIVINDGPDEIIDLCDDDPQDECVSLSQSITTSTQPDSSELEPEDEDSNVIFVSYIPPKASTESAENEREDVQEKSTEDSVLEHYPEHNVLEKEMGQEMIRLERETNQEKMYVEENASQQNVEASPSQNNETENDLFLRTPDNSVKNIVDPGVDHHTAASTPKSQLEQDRQLKRRFQITSDVKICLQRITPPESRAIPKKGPRFASVSKSTLDGIRKLMQESRIEIKKKSVEKPVLSVYEGEECRSQDPKRKKVELSEMDAGNTCRPQCHDNDLSSERAKSPSRAIGITAPSEKPELVNIVIHESTSTSTRGVAAAVVPSATQELGMRTKEHAIISRNIPKAKTLPPRSRRGKGKQCRGVTRPENKTSEDGIMEIPSIQGEESSPSKLEMANKNSEMTGPAEIPLEVAMQDEEPSDVLEQEEEPTSVEICCPSTMTELSCKGTDESPGGDLFTAAPMDPEEIKRHEKIKRLKELLKEKEAALEIFRKSLM